MFEVPGDAPADAAGLAAGDAAPAGVGAVEGGAEEVGVGVGTVTVGSTPPGATNAEGDGHGVGFAWAAIRAVPAP